MQSQTLEKSPKKRELDAVINFPRIRDTPCPICKHLEEHEIQQTEPPNPYRYAYFCPVCNKVCGHLIPPIPPLPIPIENLSDEELTQFRDDADEEIKRRTRTRLRRFS